MLRLFMAGSGLIQNPLGGICPPSQAVFDSRPFLRLLGSLITEKTCEVSMFHIITTSRTTRALYRLQSLAERFASVLTLAAVFFMAFVGVMA